MSAIVDNLWKINVQLPHVAPNRYVSPPATDSAPLPLVELLRGHGFVFVCLRFVVRLAALPSLALSRSAAAVCAAAISARHLNAVRGVGGGGGGFRLQ